MYTRRKKRVCVWPLNSICSSKEEEKEEKSLFVHQIQTYRTDSIDANEFKTLLLIR